jgi:hypothetical protein
MKVAAQPETEMKSARTCDIFDMDFMQERKKIPSLTSNVSEL